MAHVLLLLATACQDGDCTSLFGPGGDAGGATPDGSTATGGDDGGTDGPTDAPGGDDDSSGADDGVKFDTPDGATGAGDGDGDGCDKVDFLFVIDNSGSMSDEQAKVVASFPQFMDAILAEVSANDYHVMAIDTDEIATGALNVACVDDPVCCEPYCLASPDAICNNHPCVEESPCDNQLGAGKVNGATPCGITSGGRYMTHEQPDLPGTFDCAARVGTLGNGDERQVEAAITAVSDAMAGPGGCNEGFLRDDAILVVTIITDEDDPGDGNIGGSAGAPQDWYDAFVEIKNGDPNAVVMLGLIGDSGEPGSLCAPLNGAAGAMNATNLRSFIELWGDRGFEGSVCAPDYIPFFLEAVSLIDTTCDDFIPPG